MTSSIILRKTHSIKMVKQKSTTLKTKKRLFKKEANVFDKVFKENIEPLFFPLMRTVFGLKIKTATALTEKMQITVEREMDF